MLVGIGFAAGYTDRGLGFSAGVSFIIYTIVFAGLVLLMAIATKFVMFLLLLFIGIPVLYVIGLLATLLFNVLAYKAGEAIAD